MAISFGLMAAWQGFGEVEFAGWEVLRYYAYLYLTNFADYPWVVTVSYLIVLLAIVIILLFVISFLVRNAFTLRRQYYFRRLRSKYYNVLKEILTDSEIHPEQYIAERLNLAAEKGKRKHLSRWKSMQWLYFLEQLKCDNEQALSVKNMANTVDALRLIDYVEGRLRFGRRDRRLRVLRMVEYLDIPVQGSILVRMLNDRDERLRKAVRMSYMRTNTDAPFRFLCDKNGGAFTEWDAAELHQLFAERKARQLPLPSLLPLTRQTADHGLVTFLIREIAYWGDEHDMEGVEEYFDSPISAYRQAAFESVGLRRWNRAEAALKAHYDKQDEPLRRTILESLLAMRSGRALSFFRESYASTVSVLTKETALRCILLYGVNGQAAFLQMKARADKADQSLFDHVEGLIAYSYKGSSIIPQSPTNER